MNTSSGHSDTTMLKKVYQHVLEDMDKSASDKLDEIFAKKNNVAGPRKPNGYILFLNRAVDGT